MYQVKDFINILSNYGVDVYTGVPCSLLKPLINYCLTDNNINYYQLSNEGECVSFACGSYMAGKKSVMLLQNSGLGNAINPLTSLAYPYKFPFLILCGWRGNPGTNDEPQHQLMGKSTPFLLRDIKIEYDVLNGDINQHLKKAYDHMNKYSLPYALLIPKNTFEPHSLLVENNHIQHNSNINDNYIIENLNNASLPPDRCQMLHQIIKIIKEKHIIITTTGYTSKDLYNYNDRPNNFYMVGSMGCAISIALGLSIHKQETKFIVIDGDGALLMRLEGLVSAGYYKPKNLIHILLDNNIHDSTGGQHTLSKTVDFSQIAYASGYVNSFSINDLVTFNEVFSKVLNFKNGPTFIHMKINTTPKTSCQLKIKPEEIKNRLIKYLNNDLEE